MAKLKLTQKQVEDALIQAHGQKTTAADILGVHFTTIERYIAKNQTAQDIIRAMRHKRTDMAKLKLDEAIQRGESWAIMFTLRNKIDPDGEFIGERSDITSGTMPLVETTSDEERMERMKQLAKTIAQEVAKNGD